MISNKETQSSKLTEDICPRCDGPMSEYPALSREDNKTDICSDCGTEEALLAFGCTQAEVDVHMKHRARMGL